MMISGNINVICNDDNTIKSICIFDNNCSLSAEIATSIASLEAIHNTKPTAHSNLFNTINLKNQEQDSQISSLFTNKADISELPIVNNGTLTITQDGITKGTFTANASSDVTIDLDSPNINWGNITGTLSNQSDLNTELTSKANNDLSNINDSGNIVISNNAMPSDTYDDLTLGASGTEYTAPSNGYYYLSKSVNATGQGITLSLNGDVSNALSVRCLHNGSGGAAVAYIPAKKNDKVTVSYNAGGTTNIFRFYYAVGSESEAS